jgi:hypothetical protein
MSPIVRALVTTASAVILGCAAVGVGGPVWYHGISARALIAAVDGFVIFTMFASPASFLAGLPIAVVLPRALWPFVGLVVGIANGILLGWISHQYGYVDETYVWVVPGALIGIAVAAFAYVISKVSELTSRSARQL